jgi:hypothetical protein
MTQNRYSVLVGLFLLLVLTGSFFLAGRVVLDRVHNSIAAANATSTPTAVPPATVTPLPTSATRIPSHQSTPPTSTPAPGSSRVVMSTSLDITKPMTVLPSSANQFYCMVNLPNAAPSAPLEFKFQQLSQSGDYYDHPTLAGSYSAPLKFSYIYGPLQPGKWRCLVTLNGTLAGAAPFTVQ